MGNAEEYTIEHNNQIGLYQKRYRVYIQEVWETGGLSGRRYRKTMGSNKAT